MLNKNTFRSDSLYQRLLIISLALMLSGCTGFVQTKEPTLNQYQLDTNLIIDERPLEPQSITISADQGTTLYFEDAENNQLYKVFYMLKPGEQKGTVEVFTSVHTELMAPSFLTYEGEEASAVTSPPKPPVIEVKVRASPVKPAHP
ncbi:MULTISPECIES: hypothetical protein [unclassified Endozoicomonas]|uniref:hypothetical protein n=1 Tax=unclassified Endozoicomonas TaxID=2644528 RepID=UPI002147BB71|nr:MULTISPECIES: hypothetical protein [unclassified Endozoicomonas]